METLYNSFEPSAEAINPQTIPSFNFAKKSIPETVSKILVSNIDSNFYSISSKIFFYEFLID